MIKIFANIHTTETISENRLLIDIEVITIDQNKLIANTEVILKAGCNEKRLMTNSSGFFRDEIILKIDEEIECKIFLHSGNDSPVDYLIDFNKKNEVPDGDIKNLILEDDIKYGKGGQIVNITKFKWEINKGEIFKKNQVLFTAQRDDYSFFTLIAPENGYLSNQIIVGSQYGNLIDWFWSGAIIQLRKGLCFGEYIAINE